MTSFILTERWENFIIEKICNVTLHPVGLLCDREKIFSSLPRLNVTKKFWQVIQMKIQGAVIIEQGVTFAIVAVNQTVTNYTSRAIRVRNQLAQFFRNMPIILMSQDSNGKPHYYGRRDIVKFLQSIRLDQIPWKEYYIY